MTRCAPCPLSPKACLQPRVEISMDTVHTSTQGDFTIPQAWETYTPAEHARWDMLYDRQVRLLPGRACAEFMQGLSALQLSQTGIPDFEKLSAALRKLTGWTVIAVPHLVPDAVFFEHLANRRFPAGRFIRGAEQLDYLQEPDVFHDVFGHVPLLANPIFADYMQAYGEGGMRSLSFNCLDLLARLYWYTVEFGLIKTPGGLRIFGSGIVSSYAESKFALDSDSPNRLIFDLRRVMRTNYRIDDFQQTYFVIDSFEALLNETYKDFSLIYRALANKASLNPEEVVPGDTVLTRGTQEYAKRKQEQKR
ncbi:MAG: phenylalanine 4-monooxygenase [Rhodospirillaceae bacterium]|nr:phenylalanine 4-monooxygenase [Rhodospirillaceae bacterium]